MAALLLSQSRPRFRLGFALAASALLHGAAVAFAGLHRTEPIEACSRGSTSPAVVYVEPDEAPLPAAPPPEIPELPPPSPPDDSPIFSEVITPMVRPPNTRVPDQPIARTTPSGRNGAPFAKALALHAPPPEYPYEARRSRTTGEGVALLTIDPASGRVLTVAMAQSTGSAVLDQAATAGLRRWRFRSGTPSRVRCPITYTLTGAAF